MTRGFLEEWVAMTSEAASRLSISALHTLLLTSAKDTGRIVMAPGLHIGHPQPVE